MVCRFQRCLPWGPVLCEDAVTKKVMANLVDRRESLSGRKKCLKQKVLTARIKSSSRDGKENIELERKVVSC